MDNTIKRKRKNKPYSQWTKERYDSFRQYQVEYYKDKYVCTAVKLNKIKDADVIEFLRSQKSTTDWIRKAARKEIAEKQQASAVNQEV